MYETNQKLFYQGFVGSERHWKHKKIFFWHRRSPVPNLCRNFPRKSGANTPHINHLFRVMGDNETVREISNLQTGQKDSKALRRIKRSFKKNFEYVFRSFTRKNWKNYRKVQYKNVMYYPSHFGGVLLDR